MDTEAWAPSDSTGLNNGQRESRTWSYPTLRFLIVRSCRKNKQLPVTNANFSTCSCVSITLPRFKTSRSQFHCVWLAVTKPTEFVITGTEFRPLKSLAVRRYPLPGQGSAFGDNQGSDALIASCAVAQKRGMIGLKTSRSEPYNHTVSSIRANGSCFISVKNAPLVPLVQHPM